MVISTCSVFTETFTSDISCTLQCGRQTQTDVVNINSSQQPLRQAVDVVNINSSQQEKCGSGQIKMTYLTRKFNKDGKISDAQSGPNCEPPDKCPANTSGMIITNEFDKSVPGRVESMTSTNVLCIPEPGQSCPSGYSLQEYEEINVKPSPTQSSSRTVVACQKDEDIRKICPSGKMKQSVHLYPPYEMGNECK
jgi:hypothetical protein